MLKRTKGRLLLTLLVVTGFAGTINNTAPTKQERRFAIEHFKDSKTDLLRTMKGLSEARLNYKPSTGAASIKESFFQLTSLESRLWSQMEAAMKQPSHPEKRALLRYTDEELLQNIEFLHRLQPASGEVLPNSNKTRSMNEALAAFKLAKTEQIKYIKTTTSDLRNHFVALPFGLVDCYQVILLITACNDYYNQQIDHSMASASFPKN